MDNEKEVQGERLFLLVLDDLEVEWLVEIFVKGVFQRSRVDVGLVYKVGKLKVFV